MATLLEVHLKVQAARRLRPQTASLGAPVVNAAGDSWAVDFAFNSTGEIVATVTTSVRDPEAAPETCPRADA